LATVIERMMAKRPEDRFGTPAEVVTALAPFAVGCDLGRLLDEARGTFSPPAVEAPPTASTGKLSDSAHLDTATCTPLAPVLRGKGPAVKGDSRAHRESVGVAYGAGHRRHGLCLGLAPRTAGQGRPDDPILSCDCEVIATRSVRLSGLRAGLRGVKGGLGVTA
jgi:hypothetical protein